jgi:hypothetical protein
MSRKLPGGSVGSRKMFSGQENWGAGTALFKWHHMPRDHYDQETFKGQQTERR